MRRIRGQSASEISLVVSVIVLAVVAASSTMIPLFDNGVRDLGGDVRNVLDSGDIGGVGRGSGSMGNGVSPGRNIATDEDIANASVAESVIANPDLGPPTPPSI